MSDNGVVDTINSAMADEKPTMYPSESVYAVLIKSFPGRSTAAEVREFTGEDEEFLAGVEAKANVNFGDWVTAVLQRSVVSVGGAPPGDFNDLINPDRDILMLATVKATYGSTKTVRALCPSCGKSTTIEIDLDEDFPVTRPDFDINEPLKISTTKGDVYVNLPTGADTTAAAGSKNDAEANTLILSRCAVFPDGNEPADRLAWARKLNTGLRRKATEALLSLELGPKLEVVDTQCAHCDTKMLLSLDWVSLLLS